MNTSKLLYQKIRKNEAISKVEAKSLIEVPLPELKEVANVIRTDFCKNSFDFCTIVNAKSGMCSENCKYCAQSSHYQIEGVETYPLMETRELVKQAKYNAEKGVLRFSLVTSGKRLSKEEIEKVIISIKKIREEVGIEVCTSFGLLDYQELVKIKEAGVTRIHCNLETSRNYFPQICSTHTYEEKIRTLSAAQKAGLHICSGGIIGMGETMEDRIDMIFELRALGVCSIPINILNPIKGTPFENQFPITKDEIERTIAICRFIIPNASIRLAGGRGLLEDYGESCFRAGANAMITGDMLTTAGSSIDQDKEMIEKMKFKVEL